MLNLLARNDDDSHEIIALDQEECDEVTTQHVINQNVGKFMGTFGNMNYNNESVGGDEQTTWTLIETTKHEEDEDVIEDDVDKRQNEEQIAEFQNDSFVI